MGARRQGGSPQGKRLSFKGLAKGSIGVHWRLFYHALDNRLARLA